MIIMATPWHYAQIEDYRDETFGRVRRVFRWTVGAAVAGVAVIMGVVAHEIPGRSSVANPSNTVAGTPAPTPSAGAGTGAGTGTVAGNGAGAGGTGGGGVITPQTTAPPAPTPTRRAPTAVSGGTGW
jgi:hypothetical protein